MKSFKEWLDYRSDRIVGILFLALAAYLLTLVFCGCEVRQDPPRGPDVNVTIDGGTPVNVHAELPPIIVNAPAPPIRVTVPAPVVDPDTRVRVRTPWAKVNVN